MGTASGLARPKWGKCGTYIVWPQKVAPGTPERGAFYVEPFVRAFVVPPTSAAPV